MILTWTTVLVSISVFCGYSSGLLTCPDIYWRDYNGTVPEDAVPGGASANDEITYIGQGFIKKRGIFPGVIYNGQKQITVPINGTEIVKSHIQILCSTQQEAFRWITVKEGNFREVTKDKYLVRVGEEDGYLVNLGRVVLNEEIIIGKVLEHFNVPPIYYVHQNQEKRNYSFDVLVCDPMGSFES